MNDVVAVSDWIAALYLGRMTAQVKTADVTHSQIVELITSGRSGNLGLPPEKPSDFNGDIIDITPPGSRPMSNLQPGLGPEVSEPSTALPRRSGLADHDQRRRPGGQADPR
nr:hypothetical protein GCM10020092_078010 [Actinoplanes digitatis]